MVNLTLLNEVVAGIEADPASWKQSVWHSRPTKEHPCGTVHCIAGHTALTSPDYATKLRYRGYQSSEPQATAQSMLGLSDDQAAYLFSGGRTWDEIKNFQLAENARHAIPVFLSLAKRCQSMLQKSGVSLPENDDPTEDSVLLKDLGAAIDTYAEIIKAGLV